jgi:hypothetical protein
MPQQCTAYTSQTFSAGGQVVTNSNMLQDGFVMKLDALTGNTHWVRGIGGTNRDYIHDIVAVKNAGVLVTGRYTSTSLSSGTITVNKAADVTDMFVAAYTSSGDILMIETVGGSGDERGEAVSFDNLSQVYVGGYFTSAPASFGTNQISSMGDGDAFVAQLSVPSLHKLVLAGVAVHESRELFAVPNPVRDFMMINLAGSDAYHLTIIDATGKAVSQHILNEGSASIDLSDLPQGVYVIHASSQNESFTQKFIKD